MKGLVILNLSLAALDSFLQRGSRSNSEYEPGLSYWKKDDSLNESRPLININEPQIGTEIALPGERKFLFTRIYMDESADMIFTAPEMLDTAALSSM